MSDHIPTLADICSAIAEGSIAATRDGMMYQINALELRRYLNQFRSLPAGMPSVAQASASHADAGNWSGPTRISIA